MFKVVLDDESSWLMRRILPERRLRRPEDVEFWTIAKYPPPREVPA